METIKNDLSDILAELGIVSGVQNLETEVISRYQANALPYHNFHHIKQTLSTASTIFHNSFPPVSRHHQQVIFLALWFHDIVYNSQASDNEEQSAQYAQETLKQLGVKPLLCQIVADLILDTKTHTPRIFETAYVIDADLAILGTNPADYEAYTKAIRQEYRWVPEDAYRHGRAQVLQRFLAKENIPHIHRASNRINSSKVRCKSVYCRWSVLSSMQLWRSTFLEVLLPHNRKLVI